MPELVLERPTEHSTYEPVSEAAELAMRASHTAYSRLWQLAINESWPVSTQQLGAGHMPMPHAEYPRSFGPGLTNPWFRVAMLGTGQANYSMDLQPIFTPQLERKIPGFVRVYDGQHNELMPTLNVLEPVPGSYGRMLHKFVLPPDVSLELASALPPLPPLTSPAP